MHWCSIRHFRPSSYDHLYALPLVEDLYLAVDFGATVLSSLMKDAVDGISDEFKRQLSSAHAVLTDVIPGEIFNYLGRHGHHLLVPQ